MTDVFNCDVVCNERLADAIYGLTVSCPEIARDAVAGQFVNIKCGEERLLRRPISICCIDEDEIKLVFEIKGEGTQWLSLLAPGQNVDILGPLGNGFTMPDGNIIVVGGGIGAPPLLFAAKLAKGDATAILGFRDSRKIILKSEFEMFCDKVYITTDDGSSGIHGTVAAPLVDLLAKGGYAAVLACGPRLMLQSVADICRQSGVPCRVSVEERMGCGVGACLVCACETIKDGVISMRHVCKDGPVFDAGEVVWENALTRSASVAAAPR